MFKYRTGWMFGSNFTLNMRLSIFVGNVIDEDLVDSEIHEDSYQREISIKSNYSLPVYIHMD